VILRILRGRATREDLERLMEAVRTDIEAWGRIDAGPAWAQPAFTPQGDDVEFVLASTWTSPEAVLARGGDVSEPRGRLGESGLLHDSRAQHYELVLEVSAEPTARCEVIRLSSIELVPRRASAFYERIRGRWDELVGDVGLVALRVGRRVLPGGEQAVVLGAWETQAALEAATPGGLVGGDEMRTFYAAEPTSELLTALSVAPNRPPGA
jgi:hypothetical protein